MRKKPHYYEDVRGNACRRWQQLEADDELAGPWRQLFSQIQSPRHVISELLQNADDAGATSARVSIEAGVFTFQHDGKDFSEEEFRSLCRFGYSNKRNLHTIGFRGVGFKSTFSLGDPVEVFTPSLAVGFKKQRFTEPIWLENAPIELLTTVRVRTNDPHREKDLSKNLKEWRGSPASLIFFNNIKKLELDGETVELQFLGDGPVATSWWRELHGTGEPSRILVVRSEEESFPKDAIDEIRKERFSEGMEFPPCSVEIVLGLPHAERLFVVLPTAVCPDLPFSINGPFVQDPARTGIKDPAISPTNRWLLDRVGRLAAKTLLSWLKNQNLSAEERAAAYQLLPSPAKEGDTLDAGITQIVCEAFDEETSNESCVLTDCGELAPIGSCFSPPRTIYRIWKPADIISVFSEGEDSLLAYAFSKEIRNRLAERDWLRVLSPESIIERLSCGDTPPRPELASAMLDLWEFVHKSIGYDWNGDRRKCVAMVPVEGQSVLHPANSVVRLPAGRKSLSESDWAFLSQYVLPIDNDWLELIADTKCSTELATRKKLMRQILADVGLGTMSVDTIVTRASDAFFTRSEIPTGECVHFAHIVAVLDAQIPESFQYVTRDDVLHNAADGVVLDVDGQIEEVIPSEWADAHLLHADYFAGTETCAASRWRDWASSEKSLLKPFVPIREQVLQVGNVDALTEFLERRQATCPDQKFYRYGYFLITDYDFDPDLVRLWKSTTKASGTVWASVLKKVIAGGEAAWDGKTSIDAKNVQRNNGSTKSVFMPSVATAWVARFQKLPCLPDTFGTIREPPELLLRSPDTEPLMGVELFVAAELDTPDTRPLLELLGVRDTPASPMPLIRRISSLAEAVAPPIHELAKWYDALDRILVRSRPSDLEEAQAAFRTQRLIYTQQGEWVTAGEVFQSAGDLDIPDLPVIHASVAALAMWRGIGVADQPSVERILAWLQDLDTDRRLDGQELRRVRAFLHRYPSQIWKECKYWLNLDGAWIACDELDHALRDEGAVRVRELFPSIKRRTADLRSQRGASLQLAIFEHLSDLGKAMHYRITDRQAMLPPAVTKPWLAAVGSCLRRLELEDPAQTKTVFDAATRLTNTIWQPFRVLRVTPYLDATPAGQPHSPSVLWDGDTLFVREGSLATIIDPLVDELGRHFGNERIRDVLRMCAERDEDFVTEYLEGHFELQDAPLIPKDSDPALPETLAPNTSDEAPADSHQATGIDLTEEEQVDESSGHSAERGAELSDSTDDDGSMDVNEPQRQTRERTVRAEPRPTLISRFAKQIGFQWSDADEAYVHSNGCLIRKAGGLFPWEKLDSSGTVLAKYWLTEQHLTNGIDIGADLWEMMQESPEVHKLVVLGDDDEPQVVSGKQLVEDLAEDKIGLFPLKYRLRQMRL